MTAETETALVIGNTVSLPIPIDEAVRRWEQYQELTRRLLDESDYQQYSGGKRFKKKSAWRKYANAFNLDDRVTFEHVERAPDGWPLWARIRVQAVAPNGRVSEADHECHITEHCCPGAWGGVCDKKGWSNHTCCLQGCNPRSHWNRPGDIPATALTRAKNRAIADLIGAGEVSADEVVDKPTVTRGRGPARPQAPRPIPVGPIEYLDAEVIEQAETDARIIEADARPVASTGPGALASQQQRAYVERLLSDVGLGYADLRETDELKTLPEWVDLTVASVPLAVNWLLAEKKRQAAV